MPEEEEEEERRRITAIDRAEGAEVADACNVYDIT